MIVIKDKSMCSGCHGCMNICPKNCITMKEDNEGFWYPIVDREKCIECGLCEKSCPILNDMSVKNSPKAYACYNKDDEIRKESSSGGIFTLLASYIIKRGGVVYGAAFNNKFEVEHIQVSTIDDLSKLRGSKYVQSKLGNTYSEIKKLLSQEKLVYFSGTPCQVDGLLSFLNKKYDNLICQDIICHGVPSPKLWKYYLRQFKLEDNAKIVFRDKSTGWDSYSFTINQNNKYSQLASQNDYMKVFLKDLCLRPSCYDCHSKSLHRNSDITLGDFWGIKEIYSEMYDENKGTSLVFINSDKGKNIFNKILNEIKFKYVDIDKASLYN
ncbi:MAG: Coenzyme F420 hydrogenase/dehydrogenase, beta subunit C-terminal domain, partial [Thomasclavelia spiroformis]